MAIQRTCSSEEMDKPEFNWRSCPSPRTLGRGEAIPSGRGFIAGGSGTASTEEIASRRPITQIMHILDFIPHPRISMITESLLLCFCAEREQASSEQSSREWARYCFGRLVSPIIGEKGDSILDEWLGRTINNLDSASGRGERLVS